MVKYCIAVPKDPNSDPVGALYWDGKTLRSWGIFNKFPTLDGETSLLPYVEKAANSNRPLGLLVLGLNQSPAPWRMQNYEAADAEASQILEELDGYNYPPPPAKIPLPAKKKRSE